MQLSGAKKTKENLFRTKTPGTAFTQNPEHYRAGWQRRVATFLLSSSLRTTAKNINAGQYGLALLHSWASPSVTNNFFKPFDQR